MSLTLTRRYNVDRFGYLIPHRYGNLPMLGAVATYRPGEGRFGGAVAVEEGTTNLITGDTALAGGPTLGSWGGYGYDIALDDTEKFMGHPTMRVELGSSQSQSAYVQMHGNAVFPVQPGQTYTLSLYVNIPAPLPRGLKIYLGWYRQDGSHISGSMDTDIGPSPLGPTNGWVRISGTATSPADAYRASVRVGTRSREFYHRFWMCRVQVEAKPFATSFVDGTRANGILRYPDVLSPLSSEGTVSFKWRAPAIISRGSSQHDFPKVAQMGRYANNGSLTLWLWDGQLRFMLYNNGWTSTANLFSSVEPERWYDIAITWKNKVFRAFVDGERKHEADRPNLPDEWAHGGDFIIEQNASAHPNALYDELLILPYAASEEEIRAWYEADGPIPPHPDALLQWDWQTARPAQMVKL